MKQFFLSILLLLCGIATVSAQEDSTNFLFNNFQESLIYYKDGRVFGVKTNYNLIRNAFMFIDVNDNNYQKIFAEPDMISSIKVGDRAFLIAPKGLAVEVLQQEPYLSVQYRGKAHSEGKLVGYGGRSETSSVDSYSSFQAGGQQHNLNTENIILKGIDLRYEIKVKGKNKGFVGLKQFLKLYPKDKEKEIRNYIKEQRIHFDNPKQVLGLLNYAEALK